MTPLKIANTIGDDGLKHPRGRMREARAAGGEVGGEAVVGTAEELLDACVAPPPPRFVRDRLGKLATLVAMVTDRRRAIPRDVRPRPLGEGSPPSRSPAARQRTTLCCCGSSTTPS